MLASLPREWRSELSGSTLEHVTQGLGGASVFRVRTPGSVDRYLKAAKGHVADDLRREIGRTEWLSGQGIPIPKVLQKHEGGRLAAAMLSAVPGVPPQDCGLAPADLVPRIAHAFAALHALPVKACPYDETVAVRLARARRDIERDAIDTGAFDPRNAGMTPEAIYARLAAAVPVEDIVVVHGDATFDNMRVDGAGEVGFIDCGNAGRADRYVDLSLIAAEIEDHFGPEWVGPFARGYGLSFWDSAKARFFSDLYELF